MSQDIIMTARHHWERFPCFASPPTPVKTAPLCLAAELESPPCLTGNSDSQQPSTKGPMSHGGYPLSFFPFFRPSFPFSFFWFVLQWSVRMQSSRPFSDGGRQFGRGGARRRCPWLVYRELRQTTAVAAGGGGVDEGRRGHRAERRDKETRWGRQRWRASGGEKIARARDWWMQWGDDWRGERASLPSCCGNPDAVISSWLVLLVLTDPPPLSPTHTPPALIHSYKQTHTPLLILLICPLSPPR